MPYLSDGELARFTRTDPSDLVRGSDAAPSSFGVFEALGTMGTAALIGLVRSKLEDRATGEWLIPGTRWDAEACVFLGLGAVALGGEYVGLGEYRSYAALAALGVGSHFVGEVARRFGKTGELSFKVGEGVPPYDPTSFDPTQFGDPNADPQARGLSESGV